MLHDGSPARSMFCKQMGHPARACQFGRNLKHHAQQVTLLPSSGVMARMICSARMYQNDPKVVVLCRLIGLEGTPLPIRCWPFLIQTLACLQGLFVDLWPGIVQVTHADNKFDRL